MTDYSPAMMIAVIIVAFIAGYSIVSYAVKKFREAGRAGRVDQASKAHNHRTTTFQFPRQRVTKDRSIAIVRMSEAEAGGYQLLPIRPASHPASAPTPRPTASVIATERNGSRLIR